jgi:hypothetical protein
MGVAVEDGRWQDGVATVAVRAGSDPGTSFEVHDVRIVVDGETVLTLGGEQLAALAR